MMSPVFSVAIVLGVAIPWINSLPAVKKPKEENAAVPELINEKSDESNNECAANVYCPGIKFDNKNNVINHFIQCDNVPEPKDNCCLPQEKHYVCYNIMVDGQMLNFDPSTPTRTTDFTALCKTILESMNLEQGSYTKATLANEGGYMRYNYEAFAELRNRSTRHIKDLACGVKGDWPGKPKPRKESIEEVPSDVIPAVQPEVNVEQN